MTDTTPLTLEQFVAEVPHLRAALNDIEQCHSNDHARTADLIAEVDRLHEEVTRLSAETERLRALLREMEWYADGYTHRCSWCLANKSHGHLPGCKIRAALDCEL